MNKLLYIFITIITLLLLVISVTAYYKNKNPDEREPVNLTPTYTDFSISLPTAQGKNTTINNFLKDTSVVPDKQNPGLYSLGNIITDTTAGSNSPSYVVTYEEKTGYFNVSLLKKPLSQSRQEAELYLKNFLKLEDSALCALSYMVAVPGYVDETASGIDYRFSFCPGAVAL